MDIQYMEISPELTSNNILLMLNTIKSELAILLSVNSTLPLELEGVENEMPKMPD